MNLGRKIALMVSLIISVNSIVAQNIGDIEFGTNETFEVVSWNIEWFPKEGNTTINYVQEIVEAIDADVIAVQEIDDKAKFRNMGNQLDGYTCYIPDGDYSSLGYIYKTTIIDVLDIYTIYETSPYWNAFPRSPLVMDVIFNNQKYYIINNHFKCCGDGNLEMGDDYDEEYRRYKATNLLKDYIDSNLPSEKVIVVGDLNDVITDDYSDNVFQQIIDDSDNYAFADMAIAEGSSANWSFPSWPSHLDHIIITNEIFADFQNEESEVITIKIDDYLSGGWWTYENQISDHRPVGLKISSGPVNNIEKFQTKNSVYPNPFSKSVSINFESELVYDKIEFYNCSGQLIDSQIIHSSKAIIWNPSQLDNGVYYARVQTINGVEVIKLVFNK